MKRHLLFFVVIFLLLVILFIYHQCQERKRQIQPKVKQEEPVKAPPPDIQEKPPEKIEEKAEIPSPPKEQAKPVEKPVLPIPKKEAEIIRPQEEIEKPLEKPEALLEEKPVDESAKEDLIPLKKELLPPEEKEPIVTEMPIVEVPEEPTIKEEKIIVQPEELEIEKPPKKHREILPEKPLIDIKKTIALLPFNNFTTNQNALEEVLPFIALRLEERGFHVVNEKKTASFLCRERNRNITSLTQAQAKKAGKMLQTGFVLAGAIISYSHDDNPAIGISARLISAESGHIVWADYASNTGDDFTKLFGLGRIKNIDNLIPKVIEKLLASFDTTLQQLNPEESYKVVVLPFKNLSANTDAGMIVTYLFLTELHKNRLFEPIEYGDVWNNMVKTRVRQRGELTHNNIEALSESLGINTLLVGTVENYTDGTAGARPPSVSISARLLDARNNKILWFNSLELDGDDKIVASDLGKMRSADKVAYMAVSDLIKTMVKTKWQ